jgi:ankyrin repeat protein
MNAAKWGHGEIVELLIKNGAEVNAESKSGETALKLSTDSLRKGAIDVLKMYGAIEQ